MAMSESLYSKNTLPISDCSRRKLDWGASRGVVLENRHVGRPVVVPADWLAGLARADAPSTTGAR